MKEKLTVLTKPFPYDEKYHDWPQVLVIFIVSLGAFCCGTLFSWTSPSIPILISNSSHIEPITLEEASYFTVIPPISASLASPFIALLIDKIGRKKMVTLITVPHLLSWVLIAFSNNVYIFYLSRCVAGIGDAFLFNAVPTYVGEVSLPHVRGSWGNVVAISIYFGQFLVNVIGSYYSIKTTACIFLIIPIIQVILSTVLPESPYYLLMKNRNEEARESLQKLRWTENVDDELMKLTKDVKRQISESGTLKDIFTIPTNRKALLISIGIRGCQQLSGLPAFAVYTQYMFGQAGTNLSAATSAIIFSGTLCLANAAFAFVVDKFGRKPLMSFSSFTCGIVLLIEATYFYIDQQTSYDTSDLKWVPLAGMITYIFTCASGLGIIPTLMLGELFSASIKGKALCVLNISFSIYVLCVSKLFQTLTHNYGLFVPFYLFASCCFLSLIFSYYFVPETKGKSLEEIQQSLKGHKCDKVIQETKC